MTDMKTKTMRNQEILNSLNEKLKAAEESVLYLRQAKSSFVSLIKDETSEPTDVPDEPSDPWIEKTCPKTKLEIKKLDSVESIEAEIKMLQSKLEFYKELEKTKTPCEEAYKDWWGEYPGNKNWTSDATRWQGFQAGYRSAQKDYKVGEYQEAKELKTLYQMLEDAGAYGNIRLDTAVKVVKDWLYDNSTTLTEDYSTVTLKLKKGAFGCDD